MRRVLLLACVAAAALGSTCGSAQADESVWTLTELHLGGEETIFGMSCQASGCVGVGQSGVVITSAIPTGGASAWAISHVNVGEANLAGNLRGVSCPSPSLCVAVDHSGGVYTTTEPGADGGAWRAAKIPKAKQLFGVSCPSTGQCVLVGLEGVLVTSSNPTGGASAWTVTHLSEPLPLRSVSCTGALCVAGDAAGDVLASTDPAKAASWTVTAQPNGENPVLGVGCAGESLCVAGDAANVLVSTAPASPGTWATTPLLNRFQILAASCPTASLCVLSSNNGEISVSTAPTAGSASWATVHLIHGVTNALFGLSCPSEGLCVAGGKFGQLVVSTAPAATGLPAPPPPPPPPPPPGTRLLGPRKHLIRLGRRRTAMLAFRFSASGVATYYRCQLDQRPSGLCRSPRRYRVGPGRHTFRVRAFGPGGGDPTPIVFRFRVAAPTPPRKASLAK